MKHSDSPRHNSSYFRVWRREPDESSLDPHLLVQQLIVLERRRVSREEVLDLGLDGRGEVRVVVVLDPGVLEDVDDFFG